MDVCNRFGYRWYVDRTGSLQFIMAIDQSWLTTVNGNEWQNGFVHDEGKSSKEIMEY